jgi:FkbM family methyltransferase
VKHWPFSRGRGLPPKLIERRLRRGAFPMHVQDGAFVIADWRDYMAQWAFYGDHLRDAPFQASLGLLHEGDTAIDVGANIGLWALPAARRVRSRGKVWALEPVPSTAQRLESGIVLSGLSNATCARVALADRAAPRVMFAPAASNSGGAGFIRRPEADTPLEIEATTLDEFCAARGLLDAVDVLKVDVEGAERLVFEGGERLLTSPQAPAIFFELDGTLTAALGWTPADVCATLRDFGYSIHRWSSGHLAEVRPGTERPAHEDLFAFKRGA